MDKKKLLFLTCIVIVIIILVLAGFVIMPSLLSSSAQENLEEVTSELDNNIEEATSRSLEEQEKETFNQIFMAYETKEDDTLSKTSVLSLFDSLAKHNEEDGERKVDINGTVVTLDNVESLKQVLSNDVRYKVKCIIDEEGYVKTIELRYGEE